MKSLFFFIFLFPFLLSAQNRFALVIGNGDYEGTDSDLPTPVNDAEAMAKALRECGFTVIEKYNLNLAEMKKAIRDEFGVQLKGKETALFYYSGHGIRYNSPYSAELTNYFIPTDLSPNASADDLPNEAIPMSMVIGQMKKSGTIQNILLLDACRSYPPAKGWFQSKGNGDTKAPIIGSSKDIGETNSEQEFFIGYATEEGSVAQVGIGKFSPFTAAFVEKMQPAGKDIQEIFSETRKAVIAKYPEQKPYPENKLNNRFYFRPIDANLLKYNEMKPECDSYFQAAQWAEAKVCYTFLLKYQSNESYAKQQIATCEANLKTEKNAIDIPDDMILMKGGTFTMGTGSDAHSKTIGNYYICNHELTFDEYDAFCVATGKTKPNHSGYGEGKRPVINVSWYDAVEYCNWRSEQENLSKCYTINKSQKDPNNSSTYDKLKWTVTCDFTKKGYRLPSEAEWEYAARSGGKDEKYAGTSTESELAEYANYNQNYTLPVKSKKSNSKGLYDMSGNVWEWCWDWYGTYNSKDIYGVSSSSNRVLRGGSWSYNASDCTSAVRDNYSPANSINIIGFRLSRTE